MLKRIQGILSHDRFPLLAAVVGFLLLAPSLGAGLFADDLVHRVSLRPEARASTGIQTALSGDWDLFTFHRWGTPQALMDRGRVPWWTDPDFRIAFFRPLSSLWHALDYRVWPHAPWLMHLESIAVFAVGALLAAWLYRRLLAPPWAAGAAAFFFAVDDAHGLVVSWVANRHSLISGVFVLATLLLHMTAREKRTRWAGLLAPALFALALMAGESGLAGLAYLFAHAVWLDRGPWSRRLAALLPYAVITVAWAGVYRGLGYGAAGTGAYIDPGTDPLRYAAAVVQRMPILLLIQFIGVPAWAFGFDATRALPALVGVTIVLGLLGWVLAAAVRRDRRAGFFATGMLLSLLPVCAARPLERMLLLPSVGAFGLIAVFLTSPALARSGWQGSLVRATAAVLVLLHGLVAPLLLPARSVLFASLARDYVERGSNSFPQDMPPGRTILVVLNAPDVLMVNYALADRLIRGDVVPDQLRLLAVLIQGEMSVTRLDERAISVTLSAGFFADAFSVSYRGPTRPFAPGDVVAVAGMRAEIAETLPDGRPRRVLFRFDEPLESPHFRWVRWEKTRFVPVTIPRPGEMLTFPAIDYVQAVRGRE